jgi:hypothetical protein
MIWRPSLPNGRLDEPDLIRAYRVPSRSRHTYTGFEELKNFLEENYAALVSGDGTRQYLAIEQFAEDDLLELERKGLRRELPPFKLTLDNGAEEMIVKLSGRAHERVSSAFAEKFVDEQTRLGIRGAFFPMGAGRNQLADGVGKEPNASYKPRTRRNMEDDYPSFVVEVGASESLARLRIDAERWLTKTGGETRIVLLMFLDVDARTLEFERWQHSVFPPLRVTRSGRAWAPHRAQTLTYDDNTGQITGDPLILPINLLLDTVLPQVPGWEISISRQELLDFCNDVFEDM